jgi:hypothetical protein
MRPALAGTKTLRAGGAAAPALGTSGTPRDSPRSPPPGRDRRHGPYNRLGVCAGSDPDGAAFICERLRSCKAGATFTAYARIVHRGEKRGSLIVSMKAAASAICVMLAIAAVPLASLASTAAGSWTATASMATARSSMTATGLENGRVLVVGGVSEPTTELYDPSTETWSPGGTLTQPRWLHEAVRLRDGRVLVAGGAHTASAEVYDPATNRWTPIGSMNVDRYDFTATLLRDGRVLVVGGFFG